MADSSAPSSTRTGGDLSLLFHLRFLSFFLSTIQSTRKFIHENWTLSFFQQFNLQGNLFMEIRLQSVLKKLQRNFSVLRKRHLFFINRDSVFHRKFPAQVLLQGWRGGFLRHQTFLGAVFLHSVLLLLANSRVSNLMIHMGVLFLILYLELCICLLYLVVKILVDHIENQNTN